MFLYFTEQVSETQQWFMIFGFFWKDWSWWEVPHHAFGVGGWRLLLLCMLFLHSKLDYIWNFFAHFLQRKACFLLQHSYQLYICSMYIHFGIKKVRLFLLKKDFVKKEEENPWSFEHKFVHNLRLFIVNLVHIQNIFGLWSRHILKIPIESDSEVTIIESLL